eukprot:TRINITY_DN5594_c0_g1_i2.p1 TRINITY_DN5594_c0_g1~~TRINITY_DN5594_c0_g1_i2.p1  ORF type:complete len:799 (+),score=229.42 TRINITY_DN5594_c0_g1_i2:206-2602(+)
MGNNGSSRPTAQPMQAQQASQLFDQLDKNHDGSISREEFNSLLMAQQGSGQMLQGGCGSMGMQGSGQMMQVNSMGGYGAQVSPASMTYSAPPAQSFQQQGYYQSGTDMSPMGAPMPGSYSMQSAGGNVGSMQYAAGMLGEFGYSPQNMPQAAQPAMAMQGASMNLPIGGGGAVGSYAAPAPAAPAAPAVTYASPMVQQTSQQSQEQIARLANKISDLEIAMASGGATTTYAAPAAPQQHNQSGPMIYGAPVIPQHGMEAPVAAAPMQPQYAAAMTTTQTQQMNMMPTQSAQSAQYTNFDSVQMQQAADLFSQLDRNGDGVITREELLAAQANFGNAEYAATTQVNAPQFSAVQTTYAAPAQPQATYAVAEPPQMAFAAAPPQTTYAIAEPAMQTTYAAPVAAEPVAMQYSAPPTQQQVQYAAPQPEMTMQYAAAAPPAATQYVGRAEQAPIAFGNPCGMPKQAYEVYPPAPPQMYAEARMASYVPPVDVAYAASPVASYVPPVAMPTQAVPAMPVQAQGMYTQAAQTYAAPAMASYVPPVPMEAPSASFVPPVPAAQPMFAPAPPPPYLQQQECAASAATYAAPVMAEAVQYAAPVAAPMAATMPMAAPMVAPMAAATTYAAPVAAATYAAPAPQYATSAQTFTTTENVMQAPVQYAAPMQMQQQVTYAQQAPAAQVTYAQAPAQAQVAYGACAGATTTGYSQATYSGAPAVVYQQAPAEPVAGACQTTGYSGGYMYGQQQTAGVPSANDLFDKIDRDHNGYITREEFASALAAQQRAMAGGAPAGARAVDQQDCSVM